MILLGVMTVVIVTVGIVTATVCRIKLFQDYLRRGKTVKDMCSFTDVNY